MSDASETFVTVIFTPEALKAKFRQAFNHAEAMLLNGENVELRCGPAQQPIGVQQRRFLHGVVLKQIAEQVALPVLDAEGRDTGKVVRYGIETWKDFFRKQLLPPKFEMRRSLIYDAETKQYRPAKRATPHPVHVSTEELGVRKYSEFIDQVIDHAVVEFGVTFEIDPAEREGVRWQARP